MSTRNMPAEMPWIRDVLALGKGQARNLKHLLLGRKIVPTSFVSMTLDPDDVEIAERFIADRATWDSAPFLEEYERAFAAWNGCERAFAFASGRESLSACLHALGIGAGDEVVVPAFTCVVVPNAVQYAGAKVVWGDIELETYGLDVAELERRLTPRTKAVLVQHLFGLVCRDYEAVLDLAARRGVRVIEDCAHATGASFRGRRVGLRGDAAFYSSEHSKAFCTIMGGVAIARDPAVTQRLESHARSIPSTNDASAIAQLFTLVREYRQYKDPQRWWRGEIERAASADAPESLTEDEKRGVRPPGYGRRLAAPLAAVGANQIRKLDAYNERRRATAARWDPWCDARGYAKPKVIEGSTPIFLRYPVMVEPEKKRNRSWGYREFGAKPGAWFTSHTHPVPSSLAGFPKADEAVARCINLPCLIDPA
jgi:dTDP-4-amino-4,6-dideoxygalactose transaminase